MKIKELFESSDLKTTYRTGNCDVMAIALHNLTKLPLGVWAGTYFDDYIEDYVYEYCHLCVVQSFKEKIWIDVDGIHHGNPNCYFQNKIESLELFPIQKNDASQIFSMCDLESSDIRKAEDIILQDNNLSRFVK